MSTDRANILTTPDWPAAGTSGGPSQLPLDNSNPAPKSSNVARPSPKCGNTKRSKSSERKRPTKQAVTYTCRFCDFETTNIVKHFAHKRQHRESNQSDLNMFKCHNCDYSSNIKGGLQRLIKRVHTKERPFTCPVCNYRTIDKPSMSKHIIKLHKEDFGADVALDCMKAANTSDEEEPHRSNRSDIEENQQDHIAESDGENISHNKVESDENSDKSVDCMDYEFVATDDEDECAMQEEDDEEADNQQQRLQSSTFSQKRSKTESKNLNCQSLNINGIKYPAKKRGGNKSKYKNIYCTPEYREMRNRKLTCEYCKKLCGSNRDLLAHMNDHKDSGIHCPICQTCIIDPIERAQHIENHLENNPYVCATCVSTFETEHQVIAHQQQEHRKTINVIMECMFCPFSTRSLERFTRHMTRCHMMSAEIPKHNPFDVTKMKKLLTALHNDKTAQMQNNKPLFPDNYVQDGTDPNLPDFSGCDRDELSAEETNQQDEEDLKVDDMHDSILDYSLLDMSGEIDDSIENMEELFQRAEQFHGFTYSQGNVPDLVVKFQEENSQNGSSFLAETSILGLNSDNNRDVGPDADEDVHLSRVSENYAGNAEFQSIGETFSDRDDSASHDDQPHVADHPDDGELDGNPHNLDRGNLSLNHSRISSIASTLSDSKTQSISAINARKMTSRRHTGPSKRRKLSAKSGRAFSTFTSPDSTSGAK